MSQFVPQMEDIRSLVSGGKHPLLIDVTEGVRSTAQESSKVSRSCLAPDSTQTVPDNEHCGRDRRAQSGVIEKTSGLLMSLC